MTEQDRPHPSELIAEYALGVLPEPEAAAVREYLSSNEGARAEYEEMARVASLLPLAVEQEAPPESVRAGLMARIASEGRPANVLPPRPGGSRRGVILPFRLAIGAAAAAVLIVAAGAAGFLLGDDGGTAVDGRDRTLVQAAAQGGLTIERAETAGGKAVLLRAKGATEAFAWFEGLKPLGRDRAYQAWFIRDGAGPEPGPVFRMTDGGLWLGAEARIEDYSAVAFTIEDRDGATRPTSDPFLVIPVGARAQGRAGDVS